MEVCALTCCRDLSRGEERGFPPQLEVLAGLNQATDALFDPVGAVRHESGPRGAGDLQERDIAPLPTDDRGQAAGLGGPTPTG